MVLVFLSCIDKIVLKYDYLGQAIKTWKSQHSTAKLGKVQVWQMSKVSFSFFVFLFPLMQMLHCCASAIKHCFAWKIQDSLHTVFGIWQLPKLLLLVKAHCCCSECIQLLLPIVVHTLYLLYQPSMQFHLHLLLVFLWQHHKQDFLPVQS